LQEKPEHERQYLRISLIEKFVPLGFLPKRKGKRVKNSSFSKKSLHQLSSFTSNFNNSIGG